MFFHVQDLAVRARQFDVAMEPGVIDFQQGAKDRDANLRQAGPLRVSGRAELVLGSLGEIKVSGHITVEMLADCDRCLEAARFPINSDFSLFYRPVEQGYGDEKEIDAGEAEMGFYEGDGLELEEAVREFTLLALPMQRVCSEACKGICPGCGTNRNESACGCKPDVDDRWGALRNLQL